MTVEVKVVGNKISYFEDGKLVKRVGLKTAQQHLKMLEGVKE